MVGKCNKTNFDDLSSWNIRKSFHNNTLENVDDEERSVALSTNLLLKNTNNSQSNLVPLSSHLPISNICSCQRSFHIFCTDLFPEINQEIEMLYIHPAPRHYERESSRRSSTPYKKSYQRYQEDNEQNNMITVRSEPSHLTIPEKQLIEKKLRVPPKLPSRTTSLNIPTSYQRSLQTSIKYSSSIILPKQPISNVQLHIRALSVFDQSLSTSEGLIPRGPPPSPKTPTQDSSPMVFLHSITPAPPLRAVSITPLVRNSNENEKKLTNIPLIKKINYDDHAREYLSASDCSDHEKDTLDNDDDDDEDLTEVLTVTKPKLPIRNPSLSRPGTAKHDRLLSNNTNRYLSLAEVYYSSLDVYKTLSDKSRQRLRPQTRLATSTNENDDATTATTKTTTTTKTTSTLQSKSVFGFSKTASSMHFGHAAGRLGLQGRFEKWPQPLSRRTPIERKQEVTTLRLVTLPLVTS